MLPGDIGEVCVMNYIVYEVDFIGRRLKASIKSFKWFVKTPLTSSHEMALFRNAVAGSLSASSK